MGVISHKKGKNLLKRAKYLKRQNLETFSKRAERASIGTMGHEQISINYKKNFLPFDELAAPFFGEKESIIFVKSKIQFLFNFFVDTTKRQKKQTVCQFV